MLESGTKTSSSDGDSGDKTVIKELGRATLRDNVYDYAKEVKRKRQATYESL